MESPVLVRSDWDARIYIEGIGEAERRLEVTPAIAGWGSLSVRSYTFRAGQTVDGESATDEMTMVLLSGAVTIEIDGPGGKQTWECTGRESVFDGAPYAIYLPPGYFYKTTVHADADCVYGRAPAKGNRAPRLIRPNELSAQVESSGVQRTEIFSTRITEHLRCEQAVLPPGQWLSPLASEAKAVEQVVYYQADPESGWGMQRLPGSNGAGQALLVQNGDAVIVRDDPSDAVAGPETTLYALIYTAIP